MNAPAGQRRIRWGAASILVLSILGFYGIAGAQGPSVGGTVRIGSDPGEGAVVYLKERSTKPASVPPMQATIRQKELAFNPFFTVVTVGSTVSFENQDDETHNVYSATPGNRFDIGIDAPGEIKTMILAKPGAVLLRCKIHPQMRAVVFVSPSQYYAVVEKNGTYEIPKVAPGSYQIEVWHPRLSADEIRVGSRQITIGSETITVDLRLSTKAPMGAILTEVPDRDWTEVLNEMSASLDQAIEKWKEGKKTRALTLVMTTHSRIYGESGLRNAISQKLGKGRAEAYDDQFNSLVKEVQGDDPTTEAAMRSGKERLLSDLKRDLQKMR